MSAKPEVQGSACHFALFAGPDLAVGFDSAQDALNYMAEHADAILVADCALIVSDAVGMCRIALVDARKLPASRDTPEAEEA